jgi:hypothetical protein
MTRIKSVPWTPRIFIKKSRLARIGIIVIGVTLAVNVCALPGRAEAERPLVGGALSWGWGPSVGGHPNGLSGISCTTTRFCMAVGGFGRRFSTSALALVRSANRWTVSLADGSDAGSTGLSAVSCPSESTCVAVGSVSVAFVTTQLVEIWSGGKWSGLSDPFDPSLVGTLRSVSCPSVTVCVAVGNHEDHNEWAAGVALLRQGRWSFNSAADLGAVPNALNGISCLSVRFCMGVGSRGEDNRTATLSEIWNGSVWRVVPSPNVTRGSDYLHSVSC